MASFYSHRPKLIWFVLFSSKYVYKLLMSTMLDLGVSDWYSSRNLSLLRVCVLPDPIVKYLKASLMSTLLFFSVVSKFTTSYLYFLSLFNLRSAIFC